MAYAFKKQNNYLFITNTDTTIEYEGVASDVKIIHQENGLYKVMGMLTQDVVINQTGIPFLDANNDPFILDENENPFVDEDAWIDFYTTNTGFNGGGTAPTSDTSVVLYNATETFTGGAQTFAFPPNTVITQVNNVTQGLSYFSPNNYVPQQDPGDSITIINATLDMNDEINFVGWVYANVSPPTIKEFVLYIQGQDNTGFLNASERVNTFGFSFTFTRDDVGKFLVPEFDKTLHDMTFSVYGKDDPTQSRYAYWNGEENTFRTVLEGAFADETFEFGGFIKITQYV